jgi:hypothetical protein
MTHSNRGLLEMTHSNGGLLETTHSNGGLLVMPPSNGGLERPLLLLHHLGVTRTGLCCHRLDMVMPLTRGGLLMMLLTSGGLLVIPLIKGGPQQSTQCHKLRHGAIKQQEGNAIAATQIIIHQRDGATIAAMAAKRKRHMTAVRIHTGGRASRLRVHHTGHRAKCRQGQRQLQNLRQSLLAQCQQQMAQCNLQMAQ